MSPKAVATLGLSEIDLSALEFWALPLEVREAAFAKLRQEAPVSHFDEPLWSYDLEGKGYWAITKYQDIVDLSRRPDIYSSGAGAVSIPDLPEEFLEFFGSMINTDDPRHGFLRRTVSAAFTPRRLNALDLRISQLAEELVAKVTDKDQFDFVKEVAAELPLRIICEMMGVPEESHQDVLQRSNIILGALDDEYVSDGRAPDEAILSSAIELTALMEDIGKDRISNPRDDVTSALVSASVAGESLTASELASFFILLVVAGNETTRNAISWGMKTLFDFPLQRDQWKRDLLKTTPTAVEEVVRWSSPVMFMRRTLTQDVVLHSVEIKQGEKVLLFYGSANRDEEFFDNPHRFDVLRSNNRHLGFGGYGPHYCLGVHLARKEIGALFQNVLRYMPNYEVVGEIPRLNSNFINGIKHLEVRPNGG